MSDSLRPHELQHARPACPSPNPGVHWDSCPLSQWCHPAILSSAVPFSSCSQSLPASESFPMSQLFTWGDQSTGVPNTLLLRKMLKGISFFFFPKKYHGDFVWSNDTFSLKFALSTNLKHVCHSLKWYYLFPPNAKIYMETLKPLHSPQL